MSLKPKILRITDNNENIISTPYEKVILILRQTINFISMIAKKEEKIINNLEWVIKMITSHSIYSYELHDNERIYKSTNEPHFKELVDYVNNYNEDFIDLNTKINFMNSNIKRTNNEALQIPSFQLKKINNNSNDKQYINNIKRINTKPSHQRMNSDSLLSNSYSTGKVLNKTNKLQLDAIFRIKNKANIYLSPKNKNNFKDYYSDNFRNKKLHIIDFPLKINNTNNNNLSICNKKKQNIINKINQYPKIQKTKRILLPLHINNSNSNLNLISPLHSKNSYKKIKPLNTLLSSLNNSSSKIISSTINYEENKISKSPFLTISKIISEKKYNTNEILTKDFNIFELKKKIGYNNTLPLIAKTIFKSFNLLNEKIISLKKLDTFLYSLSNKYNEKILYHNSIHGADVTQTLSLFFLNSNAEEIANTNLLDILSIFIAALGHDISHPGLNNNYHINASSELAIIYNDLSCLENFHSSTLFKLLKNEENNILENIKNDDYKIIRKRIINGILSTDMANHGKVMSIIHAKINSNIDLNDVDNDNKKKFELFSNNPKMKFQEQQELLNFFIHCSDLAHNTKSFNISIIWVELLHKEFWNQGDREKKENLPVSFLCDREGINIPNSQVGFIKGFILPTFEILISVFPTLNYTLDNAKNNLKKWEELVEENRLTGWTPKNTLNDFYKQN